MIWGADILSTNDDDWKEGIDFKNLSVVLNTPTDLPTTLPPPPVLSDVPGAKREYVVEDDEGWARSVMVDFRHPSHWTPPPKNLSKPAEIEMEEDELEEADEIPDTCAARTLLLLDSPESTPAANAISVIMGMMILVSVLTLFLEPLISPKNAPISDIEKKVWFTFELFF